MSTITLTGTGGLYTRWGKELGGSNEAQNLVNGTLTTRVASINAQYASTDQQVLQLPNSNLILLQQQLQQAPQPWGNGINNMMQNTIIQMAIDAGIGGNNVTLFSAMSFLIGQMNVGGYAGTASIQRPTISVAVTTPSGLIPGAPANVGNGVLLASLTDTDGLPLDYCLTETVNAVCTNDGYTGGGATAGSEPFTLTGMVPASSIYAFNYPAGSGANAQITTLNPALTSGTILTDGNFEIWSGGTPVLTNWAYPVGVAGTTVKQATSPFTGTYNLQIVGDGAELTKVRQAVVLQPNTVYAVNCWAKTDGSVAAGVLQLRLVSAASLGASASTVINNQFGTANAISKTVSTLTSSYTNINGFFQTPAVLPATTYFEFFVSTAITNTEVLNLDSVGIQAATQLYAGGPWTTTFAGSTPFAIDDSFSIAVANNATIASFCLQLARYFGLPTLGLKIPSAVSPTINDNLIG